jgi:hypothetical protein
VLEIVAHVGSYLGAAAAGGIIGNRADAGLLRTGRWLRGLVTNEQLEESSEIEPALSQNEAVQAAKEAARTQGFGEKFTQTSEPELRPDGTWTVRLRAADGLLVGIPECGTTRQLRVTVSPKYPEEATLLVEGNR